MSGLDLLVGHLFTHTLETREAVKSSLHIQMQTMQMLLHNMLQDSLHVTYCINFIEGLPLFVTDPQSLGCLDGPLHVAGPYLQVLNVLALDELSQSPCILQRD